MIESEVGEDLKELAMSLGYSWPDDTEGRWRVLKLMATRAAYWRAEAGRYATETLREAEKERAYEHLRQRCHAQTAKVRNLRRALRQFMSARVAWVHEMMTEIKAARKVSEEM